MKNESIKFDIMKTRETMEIVLGDINRKMNDKDGIIGCPTGFTEVDKMLGGLQGGKLYCLAARPSMGMTSFALNISLHSALKNQVNTVYFSLELSTKQIISRLLSIESRVDSSAIRTGVLDDKEWKNVKESADDISHAPFAVIDDCWELEEIEEKCLDMFNDDTDGLIVIDYLQLISASNIFKSSKKEPNIKIQISYIVRRLKLLANKINVPIIILSQISHCVDNRPRLYDFMDGDITIFSDVVLFLYRDDYYNSESEKPGVTEFMVVKNSDGSTGTIDLAWIWKYQKFANLVYLDSSKQMKN